ncbi:hypothetical protein EYF80_052041 [Liparis tanakae]|uniref:Secreted protein n=1 Tax=Liparis tanakae TaxID=230148 RepID=A0A4Z2FBM6_9TELE|nr:hypothetical protein EYF80_052041 [Liparis tanakae]
MKLRDLVAQRLLLLLQLRQAFLQLEGQRGVVAPSHVLRDEGSGVSGEATPMPLARRDRVTERRRALTSAAREPSSNSAYSELSSCLSSSRRCSISRFWYRERSSFRFVCSCWVSSAIARTIFSGRVTERNI